MVMFTLQDQVRKIIGDRDDIDFDEFCGLLDACSVSQSSRISSTIQKNKDAFTNKVQRYFEKLYQRFLKQGQDLPYKELDETLYKV